MPILILWDMLEIQLGDVMSGVIIVCITACGRVGGGGVSFFQQFANAKFFYLFIYLLKKDIVQCINL